MFVTLDKYYRFRSDAGKGNILNNLEDIPEESKKQLDSMCFEICKYIKDNNLFNISSYGNNFEDEFDEIYQKSIEPQSEHNKVSDKPISDKYSLTLKEWKVPMIFKEDEFFDLFDGTKQGSFKEIIEFFGFKYLSNVACKNTQDRLFSKMINLEKFRKKLVTYCLKEKNIFKTINPFIYFDDDLIIKHHEAKSIFLGEDSNPLKKSIINEYKCRIGLLWLMYSFLNLSLNENTENLQLDIVYSHFQTYLSIILINTLTVFEKDTYQNEAFFKNIGKNIFDKFKNSFATHFNIIGEYQIDNIISHVLMKMDNIKKFIKNNIESNPALKNYESVYNGYYTYIQNYNYVDYNSEETNEEQPKEQEHEQVQIEENLPPINEDKEPEKNVEGDKPRLGYVESENPIMNKLSGNTFDIENVKNYYLNNKPDEVNILKCILSCFSINPNERQFITDKKLTKFVEDHILIDDIDMLKMMIEQYL